MLKFVVALAVVQGLTEFLPVSSSGHLALLQVLWGVDFPGLLFDALVHVGTLLSVLWVFRRRIGLMIRSLFKGDENLRLLGLVLLGTLPVVILGLLFDPLIERAFGAIPVVGIALLCSGGILFTAERVQRGGRGLGEMTVRDAVLIGTMQGIALLPGISRSGFTIGMGMLLGLERGLAAEYSFLLATPAILGAAIWKSLEAAHKPGPHHQLGLYFLGMAIAALVGIVAIRYLLRVLQQGRLGLFAYYCWAAGIGALVLGFLK